ncbi:MAG: cytochrome c3 family protein [Kofleriaceae bacterium]
MRWSFVVLAMVASRLAYAHPEVTKPCASCHSDSHKGELGTACESCHETSAWTPTTFGVARHTKYTLDGRHLATPCGGCHTGPRPRSFTVPGKECLDCHQNPHGTKFSKEMVGGGCATCHTTGTWKAWKVDHRAWPLTGGHARAACVGCHAGKDSTTATALFRGVPRACEQCHADTHAGQFERKACSDCHTTESFRTPFEHGKTRYPLEGIHTDMACSRCHPQQTLRNGQQAIRWKLGFAACADCHANRHRGVERACSTCHDSLNWKPVRGGGDNFDHASVGFALRGKHAKATCMGCHDRGMRPSTECQTCHADDHRGRLAGACAECHTPVAWTDTKTFEQHRRTRLPLTGKHAVIECAACHRRQGGRAWSDLPADCFGCHSERYRTAVPDHDGPAAFSRDCSLCHQTITWTPAIDPSLLRTQSHAAFALAGNHRVACASCHVDSNRRTAVRCDGCHVASRLRTQHRAPVAAASAATCLRCHPRGARR